MREEWIVKTPADFQCVVQEILQSHMSKGDAPLVICLRGDLGAGKTAFVQELGKVLGVMEVITSPTFAIMKQYEATHSQLQHLVHIDAYRLESEDETKPLYIPEVISQLNTVSCIEWPEVIPASIPEYAYQVQITILENQERKVTITLDKEQ